jgi:tetratricopeptide (TPR) repeat protein
MIDRATLSRRLADRRRHPACLAMALCLLAGACAPGSFEARPVSHGFDSVSGVMNPYEDGKLHLSEGRPGLAIERFRQALAQDRGSIDALNGLAVAYARLGRTEVAESYLQRALDLRYDDVATLNNYGYLLVEAGRWLEARPLLELAAQFAGEADRAVVQANLGSMRAPGVAPRDTVPPASPLRLARTAVATWRLETGYEEPADLPASAAAAMSAVAPLVRPAAKPMLAAAASPLPVARPPAAWPAAKPMLAVAALPLPAAKPHPAPFVVVANGVGRKGLAAQWRERLRQEGVEVGAIANAPSFTTQSTQIRAHPAFARQAAEIAALLPAGSRLITDAQFTSDIYVELGRDSLEAVGEPA